MKDFGEYLLNLGEEFYTVGCPKTRHDKFDIKCHEQSCVDCNRKMMGKLCEVYRNRFHNPLPPGIEWPRYIDGRLIELGDKFWYGERKHTADEITFSNDGVSVGDCRSYNDNGTKIVDSWATLANDILAKTLHDDATPEDAREWADRAADLQQRGVE